uniref:Peptidase S1 domain-containing protein n=1 Tax=Parastrongyloides trichosuri TaxID=131310 RepID=A0A0N4ZEA2_PARTI
MVIFIINYLILCFCFNLSYTSWIQSSSYKYIYLPEVNDFDVPITFNIEYARDYCTNLGGNLISFTKEDLQIDYKNYFLTTFITSAIYQAGIWRWKDQRIVSPFFNITSNNGRCLSFIPKNLTFIPVDCSEMTNVLPLCEKNIAINCQLENGQYFGNISKTKSNISCLKWNDNSLSRQGVLFSEQPYWDHNYCRNPKGYTKKEAWCLIGDNKYEECQISYCKMMSLSSDFGLSYNINLKLNDALCGQGSVSCNNLDDDNNYQNYNQCIPEEFWCDYEKDCINGRDEDNCEDWLSSFTNVGNYKVIRNITSIWSNIFHEQSCAKKCLEASEQKCNSFSFEKEKKLCTLSDLDGFELTESNIISMKNSILFTKKASIFSETVLNNVLEKWNVCNGVKCNINNTCIETKYICDNKKDCLNNEDELSCYDAININFISTLKTETFDEGILQASIGTLDIPICLHSLPTTIRGKICSNFHIKPYLGDDEKTLKLGVLCYQGECYLDKDMDCMETNNIIRCNDICGKIPYVPDTIKLRCPRIVGGCSIRPTESPWTASIRLKNPDIHHCGAVIISDNYLLTAAHCVSDIIKSNIYVRVGDYNNLKIENEELSVEIENIVIYPSYENIFQNDIAILSLSKKLNFTDSIKPICLPPNGFQFEEGHQCFISGFGKNTSISNENSEEYSEYLTIAPVPILNKTYCGKSNSKVKLNENIVCAGYSSGNIDACHGDSGGPLVCMFEGIFYLAGIVSWGEGCAEANNPGIYTAVSSFISWIEKETNTLF